MARDSFESALKGSAGFPGFVDIAKKSWSEFQVSKILMARHVNTTKVTKEALPFLWAATQRLWQKFIPDHPSLEYIVFQLEFTSAVRFKDTAPLPANVIGLLKDYNSNPIFVLHNTLLLWATILKNITGKRKMFTYDEAGAWTVRWNNWIDEGLFELYMAIQAAAEAEGRLPKVVFELVQKLENTFTDIAAESALFINIKMWLAFVNGDTADVDIWLEQLQPHLDDKKKVAMFGKLHDWYKASPAYSATVANAERAAFFERKMLDLAGKA